MRSSLKRKKSPVASDPTLPLILLAEGRRSKKKSNEKEKIEPPPTPDQINILLFAIFMIIFGAIFGLTVSSGPPAALIVATVLSAAAGFVAFAQIAKWTHLWPLDKEAGFIEAAKKGRFISHLFSTLSPTHYLIKPSEIERCIHKLFKTFTALFQMGKMTYDEAKKDGLFTMDDFKDKILKQAPPPPQHYFGQILDNDPLGDEAGMKTVLEATRNPHVLGLVKRFRPLPPKVEGEYYKPKGKKRSPDIK